MPRQNDLLKHLPEPVEQALKTLGANLKTARLRRNMTSEVLAERIGVTRQRIADAEKGKPSTSVATYVAMLWALGLMDGLAQVAAPTRDTKGLGRSLVADRKRPFRGADEYDFFVQANAAAGRNAKDRRTR